MGFDLSGFVRGLASQDPVGHYDRARKFVMQKQEHDANMDRLNYEKGLRDDTVAASDKLAGIADEASYGQANPPAPKPALAIPTGTEIPRGVDEGADWQADQAAAAAKAAVPKVIPYHEYVKKEYEAAAKLHRRNPAEAERLRKMGSEKAAEAFMAPILRDHASKMSNEEFAKKYLQQYSDDADNRYQITDIPGTDRFLATNTLTGVKQTMSRDDVVQQMQQLALAAGGDFKGLLAEKHAAKARKLEEQKVDNDTARAGATTRQALTDAERNGKDGWARMLEVDKLELDKLDSKSHRALRGAQAGLVKLQTKAAKGELDMKAAYDALVPEYNKQISELMTANETGDKAKQAAARAAVNAVEVKLSNAIRKPMQLKEGTAAGLGGGKDAAATKTFDITNDGLIKSIKSGKALGRTSSTGEMVPSGFTEEQNSKFFSEAAKEGIELEVRHDPERDTMFYAYKGRDGQYYSKLSSALNPPVANTSGTGGKTGGPAIPSRNELRASTVPTQSELPGERSRRLAVAGLNKALDDTARKLATAKGDEQQALLAQFKALTAEKNKLQK